MSVGTKEKDLDVYFEKAGISELCELFINQLGSAKKYTL